jgi:hypothetical protein
MKAETSTHIGIYSIMGGFLNIFQDVRVEEFLPVLKDLTFGQLFAMLVPFVIGLWSILHREKEKGSLS